MLEKNNTVINNVLLLSNSPDIVHQLIARPAFYIEIFEGNILEWQAAPNSAVWNKIDCSVIKFNFQQGQSKTISAILPIETFRNINGGLEYNYDTGVFTNSSGDKISKGYLIRAYSGYCDPNPPYTPNVKRKFTGIIESISPSDDGTIEISGVDFSTIFINTLNYHYPDINSYRDLPWTDSGVKLSAAITDITTHDIYVTNASLLSVGNKIKIDGETMLILDVKPFDGMISVQRLSNPSLHNAQAIIYFGDDYLVMPEDVYNDNLLNRYVPAYDNWRLDWAIRDLCIKAKFPLDLLSFLYNDVSSVRLGRADDYPYMQSKSIFERIEQFNAVAAPKLDRDSVGGTASVGYPTIVEKKIYSGINEEMLDNAKFKMEFGKSLWDCILAITQDFGFKIFFDEDGTLSIKGIRQYIWKKPDNYGENSVPIIENHIWSWTAWDINANANKRYTYALSDKDIRNIKVRFVSNNVSTVAITCQLQKNNSGTWVNVGDAIIIPALNPYQYFEETIYSALTDLDDFVAGTYGITMTSSVGSSVAPYFNGILYLDNNDESIGFIASTVENAVVSEAINTSNDVRNQLTFIGLPESPQPIVSRVSDISSIYGGNNIIKGGWTGTDSFVPGHVFMDGRYDKYALFKGTNGLGVRVYTLRPNWNLIGLFVNPQTTPIGTTILVTDDTATPVSLSDEYVITENDLTCGGIWIKMPRTYNQSVVRIYTSVDIEVSEIECYEYDPAYNYIGHKKEMIVIKKNISDKATADWMAYTQLEMHRRNVKQFQVSILGNPYLEIGDCCVVSAPEIGAYSDVKLWVTGISSDISRVGYTDSLTLSAIPPSQSYILPPDPDSTSFTDGEIYDFSITRKKTSSNLEVLTVAYNSDFDSLTLFSNITNETVFHIRDDNAVITSGSYIKIDSEYMYIQSVIYGINLTEVTVIRAQNYTTIASHLVGAKVYYIDVLESFQPPDEYLVFNFAITKKQKVQVIVGVDFRKHTLAYVYEEKILDAGVYKRENGIRWDGGINFAKVWPESVNKIYLMPNNSFNYMYNRMFHRGGTTEWEDPKRNFDWWKFDQNTNNISVENQWAKTPSFYDASLVVRPALYRFGGQASLDGITKTKTIGITTNCHSYKLKWGEIYPVTSNLSTFQPVSLTIQVKKDSEEYQDTNDAVYFDAYVSCGDGSNVNNINATPSPDTARRWIAPIALNQILQWDFTDSAGKVVTATATGAGTPYKINILNAFDIYGEGVEIIKGDGTNLIDGSFKDVSEVLYSYVDPKNPYTDYPKIKTLQIKGWKISSQFYGDITNAINVCPNGYWTLSQNRNTASTFIGHNVILTGGQANNDAYVEFNIMKEHAIISSYNINNSAPASIQCDLPSPIIIDRTQSQYYFGMFYSLVASVVRPLGVTANQIWNPYLYIKYSDDTTKITKVKCFKLSDISDAANWTRYSKILTLATDLSDVYNIVGIGIEFRFLSSETPSAIYPVNIKLREKLSIDSIAFGPGSLPAQYEDPNGGGPRTSNLFYLKP